MEWKLELVAVPVSDVDRAKAFYTEQVGLIADHDHRVSDEMRFVQLTPPGSACSIAFGEGITGATPGSLEGLQLVVPDIHKARAALQEKGVDVSEVAEAKPPGFESIEGRSYFATASFSDPDGNGWVLQEITDRLPGREWED